MRPENPTFLFETTFVIFSRHCKEIEDDTEKLIRIVSILNPSELRLQVSINRMYILISSLVNDAFEVLNGEDIDLLSDIQDRSANRRPSVVGRTSSGLSAQEPSVEKKLKVDRYTAMEHANIARVGTDGDHAVRLIVLVRDNSHLIQSKTTELPLLAIPTWAQALKTCTTCTRKTSTSFTKRKHRWLP